jgi:hypothetical protein
MVMAGVGTPPTGLCATSIYDNNYQVCCIESNHHHTCDDLKNARTPLLSPHSYRIGATTADINYNCITHSTVTNAIKYDAIRKKVHTPTDTGLVDYHYVLIRIDSDSVKDHTYGKINILERVKDDTGILRMVQYKDNNNYRFPLKRLPVHSKMHVWSIFGSSRNEYYL